MYTDLQALRSPPTHNFCFPRLCGSNTVLLQRGPGCVLRGDPLAVGGADAVGKEAGYSLPQPLGRKKKSHRGPIP